MTVVSSGSLRFQIAQLACCAYFVSRPSNRLGCIVQTLRRGRNASSFTDAAGARTPEGAKGRCKALLLVRAANIGARQGLPRDHFAVSPKLSRFALRRIRREPDDSGCAFGNGTCRACATHLSSHPAGTDGIDRKVWEGGGELDGDAVQRRLGDAVGGRPTVGAVGQLSAAAGNIDDPRIVALSQEGHESLRDKERPERIGSQRR